MTACDIRADIAWVEDRAVNPSRTTKCEPEMITVDCPCCDHEIRMEFDAAEIACSECAVTAEIAPDARAELAVAA
jgi:hypothetical protein